MYYENDLNSVLLSLLVLPQTYSVSHGLNGLCYALYTSMDLITDFLSQDLTLDILKLVVSWWITYILLYLIQKKLTSSMIPTSLALARYLTLVVSWWITYILLYLNQIKLTSSMIPTSLALARYLHHCSPAFVFWYAGVCWSSASKGFNGT